MPKCQAHPRTGLELVSYNKRTKVTVEEGKVVLVTQKVMFITCPLSLHRSNPKWATDAELLTAKRPRSGLKCTFVYGEDSVTNWVISNGPKTAKRSAGGGPFVGVRGTRLTMPPPKKIENKIENQADDKCPWEELLELAEAKELAERQLRRAVGGGGDAGQ